MWEGYPVGRVLDGLTGLPDLVVIHFTADLVFSLWDASSGPENEAGGLLASTLGEEVLRLDRVG